MNLHDDATLDRYMLSLVILRYVGGVECELAYNHGKGACSGGHDEI